MLQEKPASNKAVPVGGVPMFSGEVKLTHAIGAGAVDNA